MSINNMRLFCRDAPNPSPSEPGDVVYAGTTAVALQRRAEDLGHGEYSYGYAASARFPAPEDGSQSTPHPTALAARVITEVSTVLVCTTSKQSTATTPVDEYLLDLGYLIVRSA